jgi:hypothetical protein
MASDKQYRTVTGVVEFPPRDGEAGGKTVRNITISNGGFKEQAIRVYATLWPSHSHVAVEEGDVVTVKGSYARNVKEDKVYHNLSVSGILNHGRIDSGDQPATTNDEPAADAADDDIPF